ncbi:MAG TPA: hypothetical protein PLC53_02230 [Bacilli bacterium]|nr:hypothetical protein [Bacilli bacterium]
MKKVNKFVYWIPRILSIILILLLTMLSFDVISDEYTIWEIILGLFMHNIPTIILLIALIISWKHEIVGGIIFNLAGLLYIGLLVYNRVEFITMLEMAATLSGPAFLIGILFIINWFQKKKVSE